MPSSSKMFLWLEFTFGNVFTYTYKKFFHQLKRMNRGKNNLGLKIFSWVVNVSDSQTKISEYIHFSFFTWEAPK